jgi:argininosuccinate lyase
MNNENNSENKAENNALWGGRFSQAPDEAMARFSTSLPIDARLWQYDIRGSIAHAQMLTRANVIAEADGARIIEGLRTIGDDLIEGILTFEDAPDEDIHSFIERHLTQRIGPVAGKLHTGRSRNDQIALDVRLYLKDALNQAQRAVRDLQEAILERAGEHLNTILPGYTHLQRAQPVLLAHHLLAYFWMLQRDHERLGEAARRNDVLPLGAAAMAGTTFPIDRHFVARELGFSAVSENSMDTVADRDHMIESVSALTLIALHLSRLAEEFILWSASEWGFVTLDDRFSTGSSIMPQKKNPDSMELIRGKSGRVIGDLNALLVIVKGLPLTYNRDLQEDKEPLFDAFETVIASLQIARGVIESVTFHTQAMLEATDIADYLVRHGVPFREAHEIVGRVVNYCEVKGKSLDQLIYAEWQSLDHRFGDDVTDAATIEASVEARGSYGGTSPSRVAEQLETARRIYSQT